MRAASLLRHATLARTSVSWPGRPTPWATRSGGRCCGSIRRACVTASPPPPHARRHPSPARLSTAAPPRASGPASASSPPSSSHTTPLGERPPTAAVSLADLGRWATWAAGRVAVVGDGLASDGGPTAAELQSELRWFLEDAVAGRAGPDGGPPPQPNTPTPAWSILESEARAAAAAEAGGGGGGGGEAHATVWLRSPLPDLTARWAARLDDRVPFQYAVGSAHWRDLILAVGPGVLCPRPETEQLVDLAVAAAAADAASLADGGAWADVCTGSGAVAAGLVTAFRAAGLTPPSTVWATDACPTAAGWAAANVRRLGLGGVVRVATGDLLAPIPPAALPLRGIVSNPPYIPRPQMAGLQAEVGRHEPALALDGGDEAGLVVLRRLCEAAPAALVPGGFLGLETAGHGQAERVAEILEGGGECEGVAVVDDLYGVARFVTARRRGLLFA